jgi:hypothetical protein
LEKLAKTVKIVRVSATDTLTIFTVFSRFLKTSKIVRVSADDLVETALALARV